MRERIRAFTRAFQRRNGWHKIGVAVGIVIVAFALTTLFRLLRDIEIDKVVVALRRCRRIKSSWPADLSLRAT